MFNQTANKLFRLVRFQDFLTICKRTVDEHAALRKVGTLRRRL